jgi:hypothetical protein
MGSRGRSGQEKSREISLKIAIEQEKRRNGEVQVIVNRYLSMIPCLTVLTTF